MALLFLTAANSVTAQHIGYRDRTRLTTKQEVRDTLKTALKDTLQAEIVTPHNECPGMDASLPVLTNYVPGEIVTKFKEKFQGHVYSITSLKVSENELEYKLKVCYKGEFLTRFVDANGNIVR